MPRIRDWYFGVTVTVAIAAATAAAPARAEQPLDYDRDVRPILAQHCFKCHDRDAQKGGLRLDQKPSMLRGGDSGEPAVVPGVSRKSSLVRLVTSADPDERMPPKGERVTPEQVAVIRRWIDGGAHWVDPDAKLASAVEAVDGGMRVSAADRAFWSFVPPKMTEPPAVRNGAWPRTRVDRFVLGEVERARLTPAAEASGAVLIRRLSFDLTGLPPTPGEVEDFLADDAGGAYGRLVDRLLASPRFGERMASLWLPLARYAEDQAHQVGDDTKHFYPNAWRYRRWVIDAFNRDLPYDRFVSLQIAADRIPGAAKDDLAALGFLGLGPKYYNRGRLEVMADEWEDRVDTVTRTTLGLTVACARCHDHKFDPIPTTDYYALAGVFAGTRMVNKVPGGEAQKGELVAEKVDPAAVHAVEDGPPQNLNLFVRGNPERKGPVVPRRFLTALAADGAEPTLFKDGSGRLELARAIADPRNPLTARVMVNRVWGMVFGRPLVGTPSNFGRTGEPPTHPALLDDLAARFAAPAVDGGGGLGWSVKALVRELVTSAAYRQSSAYDAANAAIDPANQKLWRMNRRRLTAEQWRDTALYVSEELDPAAEGPSMELGDAKNRRRTVYARVSRLKLNDLLMQWDYPDANVHAERRATTITPAQKLFVLNSPFVLGRAKALAERLGRDAASDDEGRVRRAYGLLFARPPSEEEMGLALAYVNNPGGNGGATMSRWERLAQVLLASNEALYVD